SYPSSLDKKKRESETLERDREAKVNVALYVDAPQPVAAAPPVAAAARVDDTPMFGAHAPEPSKSKAPLAIAAALILAIVGGGAYMMMNKKGVQPSAPPVLASSIAAPAPAAPPRIISQPVVASPAAATATVDPNAQKKAFEDAVEQKMQEEMMKLQSDYTKKLQQQQGRNAPVPAAPATQQTQPQVAEERGPSAAALDEQRRPAPAPKLAP